MVTIYGISKCTRDKLGEVEFIDEVHYKESGDFDVTLSEEIKASYDFGMLTLSDRIDVVELDQLDFAEVVIR